MSEVRESVTCEVCSEKYGSGKRDPLFLPCGHTFCRSCLINIKNKGNFLCPSCRKSHNQLSVEQLPVIYSLLRISTTYVDFELDSCKEHGDELKYWCYACKLPLCSLCLYSGHPGGHKVQLAKYFLQEKKRELEGQAEVILDMIKQQQNQGRNNFEKLFRKIFYFTRSEANLANLVKQVQETSSIVTIFELGDALKQMQSDLKVMEAAECGANNKEIKKNDKEDTAVDSVKTGTGKATAREEETMRGVMDCCSGRILLRSLDIPTGPNHPVKVEVFLELHVGDRCLGRVFLRLWTHLRRAQHFLALCLGCYGYTYKGASASDVLSKGAPREGLGFRDCWKDNTLVTDQGLINDLEWGGQYQGDVSEGVVAGYTNQCNASSFVITTRSQPGGKYECPFGEVTSGLEVVKAAVSHNPVTDVKISNCGLVLPDMTQ